MSITLSEESREEGITTTVSIPEDANEGSLRPKTLNEYIGQITQRNTVFEYSYF